MALKSFVTDQHDGRTAGVTSGRALRSGTIPVPSAEIGSELLTLRKHLCIFAANEAGSDNMNVDGSATNVSFRIPASAERTRVIVGMKIIFESGTANMNSIDARRFGAATAVSTPLTNGVLLLTSQGSIVSHIFAEPVVRLSDFLSFSDTYVSIVGGGGAGVDYDNFMLTLPEPIALPLGTTDFIEVLIRDNLTALQTFQLLGYGWQEE